VSSRLSAAAAALVCLAIPACGGDETPAGAPAPPEASADTDCVAPGTPSDQPVSPPRGAGTLPYGFNDHAGLVGELSVAEDAELHRRAGSTLWRVAIDWRFAEPEPDELELETHDAIYCEALARGVRPVFHITGAPGWAAEPGDCPVPACIDPPRSEALGDLRKLAGLVAERYPGAAAIEAWNEPNLATFWTEPDPEAYAKVLEAIHEGVRATDPTMPVLGGSLSNTTRTDATRMSYRPFLRRLYAAGGARWMDGLAFHPYPVEPLGSDRERFTRSMADARRLARDPIWVTEVGLPVTDGISEGEQATTSRAIYDRLADTPGVRAVIFHTLVEAREEAGEGTGFGWLVPEGEELVPRPVWEEFAGR
jgi:polysaccharide biosynthesis protein PslG